MAAAENSDVAVGEHGRLHAGNSADAVERVCKSSTERLPLPGSRFFLGRTISANQGEAGRMRPLNVAFTAGVAQAGVPSMEHKSPRASLKSAGKARPLRGSA